MPVTIKKGTAISSLSMTPLIDIVFLLLIFFLATTRFSEEDHEGNVYVCIHCGRCIAFCPHNCLEFGDVDPLRRSLNHD